MPFFDLAPELLATYLPPATARPHFDQFWRETLDEARTTDLKTEFVAVDNGLELVTSYDVTFNGYGGHPIRGWLQVPAGRTTLLAAVVEFVGYGGGRGLAHESLLWANAGLAHLVMDTRGQGSTWRVGHTPDPGGDGAPAHPGYLTRGILDPHEYYYRRVITDAVRAVEAVREHPAVDPGRVVVAGGSQGGGLALAAGALVPDLAGVLADVPFLCDFPRATALADTLPYLEIANYLKVHRDQIDRVFATLSYFDGVNFADRGRAPTLFSVALMDHVCPPSTVYAAYNHYAGPKDIRVYPYNDHEGGQAFHDVEKLRWVRELW